MSEIFHTRTYPIQVNQCRLDPVISGNLLALPFTKTTLSVWDVTDVNCEPLTLKGHQKPVSSICFSHEEPKILCTAAEDFIFLWNIRKCLHNAAKGSDIHGEVLLTTPGDVTHVCFSFDGARVAACVGVDVKVVSIASAKVEAVLQSHTARVTSAEFCPHFSSTLVTISDDRTVIVWDVENFLLIYQSALLTAAPLISMCMNHAEPHVAVASAGGSIKVFDLSEGKNFRQLCQLDVGKVLSKYRQGQLPTNKSSPGGRPVVVSKGGGHVPTSEQSQQAGGDFCAIESSDSVHSLMYTYATGSGKGLMTSHHLAGAHTHGAVGEVLTQDNPVLVIVASYCMLQVDSKTLQVLALVDLSKAVPSTYQQHIREVTIGGIGLSGVSQLTPTHLAVVVGTQFESRMHNLLWKLASLESLETGAGAVAGYVSNLTLSESKDGHTVSDNELCMVANKPLADNSPLKSELIPASPVSKTGSSHRGSVSNGKVGKKPDPMNQPLTFKSKVKSSGYTQAPRMTMFKPKTNLLRSKSMDVLRPLGKGINLVTKISSQEYPIDAGPPQELDTKLSMGSVPASITDIKFSNSGTSLACALSSKMCLIFPSPFGQKESSALVGHDGTINSVHWSNSGKYLLSTSSDKTAIIWDRVSCETVLIFNSVSNNCKEGGSGNSSKDARSKKEAYVKEVRAAQFFYMDKFVLLTVGNQLCLYKYHLDPSKDDIRRYLTKSCYKLVKSWETVSQNFTALSAPNTFYSHLAVCAGSNRDLEIYDLNAGRLSHCFQDAHSKPVHSVALNEGSTFTSQPHEALNVFATSATLDCIKLWDTRSRRCVLRLQGHSNQARGCGIAFSACGTYLASGSEDKLAYVYDVRQGTFCQKLRGHTDVVLSVAFHPACPLLATGSVDGKVLLFKA